MKFCPCLTKKFAICHLLQIMIIVTLALLMLSACGSESDPAAPTPELPASQDIDVVATAEPTATVTTAPTAEATPVAAEPTPPQTSSITVAVNPEFKPFLYLDEADNMTGFDIDIMNALSKAGNFEVAYVPRPFDGMLDALAAGEYDAAISAITINESRLERVDFTQPYFEPGQAGFAFFSSGLGVAVRGDEMNIMGKDDLTPGTIIGVKRGTTGDEYAASLDGVTVVRFDESGDALSGLADGAVDAVVVDLAVIADYAKQNAGAIKLVGGPITEEQYGIAVAKERQDVLNMLNAALAEIRADGTYDQIVNTWFSAP